MRDEMLVEVRRLLSAGDYEAAEEGCATALELAGEDLDATDARALQAQVKAAARAAKSGGALAFEAARPAPAGDSRAERSARTGGAGRGSATAGAAEDASADSTERAPEDAAGEDAAGESATDGEPPYDGEALEGTPEEVFEALLQALPEEQAEAYRGFGPAFLRGYLLVQEGRGEEAIAAYGEAPGETRAHPLFRLETAQALLIAGRDEEALSEIEGLEFPKAIDRQRGILLMGLYDRVGRREEAEVEARKIWEEMSKDQVGSILYCEILLEHEKYTEALEVIDPHVDENRVQPDVDVLAARAHGGLGEIDEARGLLERIVESYFQGPVPGARRQAFPIAAARELLLLYIAVGEDPKRVRAIAQHLAREDPGSAATYRERVEEYEQQQHERHERERAEPEEERGQEQERG